MTNYMDGAWHEWHGGECPVPNGTHTEVEFEGKSKVDDRTPEEWDWDSTCYRITRFRVLNPQPTQTGPVRTVTRTTTHKEIVPGDYGKVRVDKFQGKGNLVVVGIGQDWIKMDGTEWCSAIMSASDLTAAIATLTAIRDALAEQETQA